METIQLNGAMHPLHRYACQGIRVEPDPPRVGEATTLALAFKNTGPQTITIHQIQFMIAAFGMGVGWEKLPLIENILLPVDPRHVEEVAVQWTPTIGGHRCVRATIEADVLPQPLRIGRNLEVINAAADKRSWQVPFRLGNPENERMPITLELGGEHVDGVDVMVLLNGRLLKTGQSVWLNAREEREAHLFLHARTAEAIRAVQTVEAHIEGRFIDGIQVELYRPAYSGRHPLLAPEQESEVENFAELASPRAN